MNKILTFIILTIISANLFGQNADELNEQSKKFIQTQEFDKAVPLLKQASDLGSPEAQYNLGYCYQSGIGVDQDLKKSIELFSKSAVQGWNNALYALMMAYGNGNGVKQDSVKAFEYALRCAKNNDATCMLNVVTFYKDGFGTEKDKNKMLEWLLKLAKLENPENLQLSGRITSARLNLAYMYRDGLEVEKDSTLSYYWFLIYNEFKIDFSYQVQLNIIDEIKELESKLPDNIKLNAKDETIKIINRPLINLEKLYTAEIEQNFHGK
tara:strand:+ start:59 stop:859 length:801 start_codon:yes stop_codon:yes gene_type:complete